MDDQTEKINLNGRNFMVGWPNELLLFVVRKGTPKSPVVVGPLIVVPYVGPTPTGESWECHVVLDPDSRPRVKQITIMRTNLFQAQALAAARHKQRLEANLQRIRQAARAEWESPGNGSSNWVQVDP